MRSGLIPGKTLGIIVVLALLLEGCGHKGPLTLPPKAKTSKVQATQDTTTNPQTTDTQQPGLPAAQPNK